MSYFCLNLPIKAGFLMKQRGIVKPKKLLLLLFTIFMEYFIFGCNNSMKLSGVNINLFLLVKQAQEITQIS